VAFLFHHKSTTFKKLGHSISIKEVLTWFKDFHQTWKYIEEYGSLLKQQKSPLWGFFAMSL